ncbi:MAG: radical SAM protein, partial [Clostridia bacterium]
LGGGDRGVRPGTVELCRQIGRLSGLKELCITTNGLLLPELAGELLAAGVSHINVSLDSLRAERYAAITRRGTLAAALRGLDCALNAGFAVVKLNMVLIGGVNDDELGDFIALTEHNPIEVRFLELMPMGECANWPNERFISADTVLERFPALAPLAGCGVAERYRMPGYAGTVGLIRPMSNRFCDTCSRVRITADGMLKPCLHSGMELSLRGLHGETLVRALREGILQKPEHHVLMDAGSAAGRRMNEIGG